MQSYFTWDFICYGLFADRILPHKIFNHINKLFRKLYYHDKLRTISSYLSEIHFCRERRHISDSNDAARISKWIPSLAHKMETKSHFRCLTHKLMQNKAVSGFYCCDINEANNQHVLKYIIYMLCVCCMY